MLKEGHRHLRTSPPDTGNEKVPTAWRILLDSKVGRNERGHGVDEAHCRDQRVTGPECEGFVAALPGSKLESNGVLREIFREN